METTTKLHPGQTISAETFKRLDGEDYTFGGPGKWQALFVFRGQHCPICKTYLGKIEAKRDAFEQLGVEVAAISADSEQQTRVTAEASKPAFPLLYGLDILAMQRLGLYISSPRSAQETDHPFPEPALLMINPEGVLQIVDIANAPFVRPDLDTLLGGIAFVIERNYPIRGTYR
ncbi:MAG: thioredoxin peroxidase [Rhodospirillales bacterium 20-64-7]|nr:MAG: thioredoxin peroxidase [Rhodospirillales bacterium 20-64-7]HQT79113.1 redoxin domain-containing protein [Rhodopila sp.]